MALLVYFQGVCLQVIINAADIYIQKLHQIQARVPVKVFQNNYSENFQDVLSLKLKENSLSAYNLPNSSKSKDVSRTPSNFNDVIKSASSMYGVAERLISAVVKAESNFNPMALSKAGAMGLMQLMPATAKALGVADPYNPEQNIFGGTRYLRQLLDRYGGDVKMALAAYNCGSGTLNRLNISDLDDPQQFANLPSETRNYIKTIMQYMGM